MPAPDHLVKLWHAAPEFVQEKYNCLAASGEDAILYSHPTRIQCLNPGNIDLNTIRAPPVSQETKQDHANTSSGHAVLDATPTVARVQTDSPALPSCSVSSELPTTTLSFSVSDHQPTSLSASSTSLPSPCDSSVSFTRRETRCSSCGHRVDTLQENSPSTGSVDSLSCPPEPSDTSRVDLTEDALVGSYTTRDLRNEAASTGSGPSEDPYDDLSSDEDSLTLFEWEDVSHSL